MTNRKLFYGRIRWLIAAVLVGTTSLLATLSTAQPETEKLLENGSFEEHGYLWFGLWKNLQKIVITSGNSGSRVNGL